MNTFTITVTQPSNGSISPSGTVTLNQGASQTFTIGTSTGYSITAVTVDGINVGTGTSYSINNILANHTITASTAINTYAITVTQATHGTISPGTTSVNYGANQTFNITPDSNYHVASLTVDGSPAAVATSYTFNNVTATHTYHCHLCGHQRRTGCHCR